jgi:hypothetical protein
MANSSILAAFERLWYHVRVAIAGKADVNHDHNTYATKEELENVLGGAAAKNVKEYNEANPYLVADDNSVPTVTTMVNFVQVSRQAYGTESGVIKSIVIPAGSNQVTVDITPRPTSNEILVPASGTSSYYTVLNGSTTTDGVPTQITFYRAPDAHENDMGVICYLTRLKVMKY